MDTSDADAISSDILENRVAYVDGEKIVGSMPNNGTINIVIDGISNKVVDLTSYQGYIEGGTISLDNTIDDEVDEQATLIEQLLQDINDLPTNDGGGDNGKPTLFTPTISFTESSGVLTITDTANGNFTNEYKLYNSLTNSYLATLPTKKETLSNYVTLNETTEYRIKAIANGFNDSEYSAPFVWHYYETLDGTPGLTYSISGSYATCTGVGSSTDSEIVVASQYDGKNVTKVGGFDSSATNVTKITLPGTVTSTSGSNVIYQMPNIEELVIDCPRTFTANSNSIN